MKKFLSVFLALSLLLTLCPAFTLSAAALEAGDFTYEALADGTIEITGYNGTSTDVVIPTTINNTPVTSIADYAFLQNFDILRLVIPPEVKHIGSYAFFGCINLENLTVLSDNLISIGDYAFANCSSLSYYVIPSSVTSIGEYATNSFVTGYDEQGNFQMEMSDMIPVLVGKDSYGEQYVQDNGLRAIYNINNTYDYIYTIAEDDSVELLRYIKNESQPSVYSYINGHPVTAIGTNAFVGKTSVTTIVVPNTVKSIGASAFFNCENLSSVTLPSDLEQLGELAFFNCTSLNELAIPYNTVLDSYAIGYKYENGYVVNPDFTAYVYEYSNAYRYCNSNEIPYELRYFASGDYQYSLYYGYAFIAKYTGTDRYVTVPNTIDGATVYSIGNNAFAKNRRLYSVTLPETVQMIYPYAFSGCYFLSDVEMPGVRVIGSHAFDNCWSLDAIDLFSVNAIGDYAFYKCSSLSEVNLYNGLESIDYMAFADCDSLEELTIPYSVVGIKNFAMGWSDDDTDPDRIIRNENFTVNMFKGSVGEDYAKRYAQYYNVEYTFNHNYIGDVNGDGVVNVSDVTEIQRAMAGYTTISGTAKTLADVNSDHSVNINDATDLQWLLAFAY